MLVLGVDPGVTTGYAKYDTELGAAQGAQYTDPLHLGQAIEHDARAYSELTPVLVVETFPGGGPRMTGGSHTLEVLGFARWYAQVLGLAVVLQAPQQRLPFVERARKMLGSSPGKHEVDALAHALAFAARTHGKKVPTTRTDAIDIVSTSA